MTPLAFTITLIDECVFSSTAATVGENRSREYLPGAVLRGAAARALYGRLGGDAWAMFHSGQVRFGDGLPLLPDGTIAYPTPLSLHGPKDTAEARLAEETRNLAIVSFGPDVQAEQQRGGHVALDGRRSRIRQRSRLRTTVNPETGLAAQGGLFGYSALPAGARFVATVEVDDEVSHFADLLGETLAGDLRLGRSKGSEYGRARSDPTDPGAMIPVEAADGLALAWLLSDAALIDRDGLPTLVPEPQMFGLGAGTALAWDRTFLRTRRMSLFNASLRMPERELEVVERGSVLAFTVPERVDRSGPIWIGAHRESGFGRCVMNPAFLRTAQPTALRSSDAGDATGKRATPESSSLLLRWVTDGRRRGGDEAARWAVEAKREVALLYASAASYEGLAPDSLAGPRPAQWGRILQVATQAAAMKPEILMRRLEDIASKNDDHWNQRGLLDGRPTSFRDWLLGKLRDAGGTTDTAQRIGLLARAVSGDVKGREAGHG